MSDYAETEQSEAPDTPAQQVIKMLDMKAYNERLVENNIKGVAARVVGPTWEAFIGLQPSDTTVQPEITAANRLLSLHKQVMVFSERAIQQGVHKGLSVNDIETVFRREIQFNWDTLLRPEEQEAIVNAKNGEQKRQMIKNRQQGGMSGALVPSEKKMLADTLWLIRDIK